MAETDEKKGEQDLQKVEQAGGAVAAIGKAGRLARLNADYSDARIISERAYNAALIGTVLWGVILSFFLSTSVGNIYDRINPILFLILYLVVAVSGCVLAVKSQNPGLSFLGFNMVAVPFGLLLSTVVSGYLEMDPRIVYDAILYTGLITLGMFGMALAFPEFVSRIGGMLCTFLCGLVVCELVLLLLGISQNVTDWIGAGIFSFYIAYDIYRSQQFEKTLDNAIDGALDIYLDIANLFIRILSIIARSKRDD